jgi:hypothetical protein
MSSPSEIYLMLSPQVWLFFFLVSFFIFRSLSSLIPSLAAASSFVVFSFLERAVFVGPIYVRNESSSHLPLHCSNSQM